VLDRDPDAIAALRAHLTGRRDAAARILAFEFAARVQAEIEGLDWIIAEQKVTRPSSASFDVHGLAGGIRVCFEIRDGCLTGWTQRASTADDAVDVTPPQWAAFARRNAELAASLSRHRLPGRLNPHIV
jgi:excinuclease ABC subunit C